MSALVDTEGRKIVVRPDGSLTVVLEQPDGTAPLSPAAAAQLTNNYLFFLISQVQLTNQILAAFARDRGMNLSDEIKNVLSKQFS